MYVIYKYQTIISLFRVYYALYQKCYDILSFLDSIILQQLLKSTNNPPPFFFKIIFKILYNMEIICLVQK